jgi:hypothetical protein
MRRSFVALGVAVVLAASGCFKEKLTMTVYPDGTGKLAVEETIGKELAALKLRTDGDGAKKKAVAEKLVYGTLSEYLGVCAWTDLKVEVTADDEIKASATGYFEDVTKLNPRGEAKWTKNADGGFTFDMSFNRKDALGTPLSRHPERSPGYNFLKQDDDMLEVGMDQLSGFKREWKVVMPGEVSDVTHVETKEGRNATYTLTDKEVVATLKKCFEKSEGLRKKIAAGDKTEDDATVELCKDMAKLAGFTATCKAGDVAAEQKENQKAMDAAKKEYSTSETRRKILEATLDKPMCR